MSLDLLKDIFTALPNYRDWHAYLLSFTHSAHQGTTYNCRRIEFDPADRINSHIQDISSKYVGQSESNLDKYLDVCEYDGTCSATTIYRISENNSDLKIDVEGLLSGIANANSEINPFDLKAKAYILCGKMNNSANEHQIKLISMNTPVTTLKNRFLHQRGKFIEIPDKVLNLRTSMNVVIYDKTVYFLDMSGETLFNMERAYKNKCDDAVKEIENLTIISDPEVFRNIATSGHNPRRFAAFSKTKLHLLKKKKNRERAAKCFNIPLTEDKIFDTSQKVHAENLVKILCGKAMWDVLEKIPVEVDGSKNWVS